MEMAKEPKRLFRSKTNKVISGILGGLGDYLNMDPVILRLIWLLVVVFTGFFPGLIVYIIASIIVPVK